MSFQKTVKSELGYGIPGEFGLAGDVRAQAVHLEEKATLTPNGKFPATVLGRVATLGSDDNLIVIGGTGVYLGVVASPKEAAGNVLIGQDTDFNHVGQPLTVVSQTPGMWAYVEGEIKIGNPLYYTAEGVLTTVDAGNTLINGSQIVRHSSDTEGLALVSLIQLPKA